MQTATIARARLRTNLTDGDVVIPGDQTVWVVGRSDCADRNGIPVSDNCVLCVSSVAISDDGIIVGWLIDVPITDLSKWETVSLSDLPDVIRNAAAEYVN